MTSSHILKALELKIFPGNRALDAKLHREGWLGSVLSRHISREGRKVELGSGRWCLTRLDGKPLSPAGSPGLEQPLWPISGRAASRKRLPDSLCGSSLSPPVVHLVYVGLGGELSGGFDKDRDPCILHVSGRHSPYIPVPTWDVIVVMIYQLVGKVCLPPHFFLPGKGTNGQILSKTKYLCSQAYSWSREVTTGVSLDPGPHWVLDPS